jgi:hypothetical protein
VHAYNSATKIATKFKSLRKAFKIWSKGINKLGNLIKACNEAILVLDKIEEQRNLSIPELNFRLIIKDQVKKLLRCKNDYWRQRCTIRWVQLGDEPTRFFHAAATESYRKMLYPYYRMRMGETSQPTQIRLHPS